MNIPRLLIAIVVIYFLLWGLAILFYDVLLAEQFADMRALMRPEDQMTGVFIWMILGYLVQVVLFCVIFLKGYENQGPMEGLRYGLLIGALLAAADFVWVISLPLSVGTAVSTFVLSLVMWAIAGVVLALIYKPKAAESAAV